MVFAIGPILATITNQTLGASEENENIREGYSPERALTVAEKCDPAKIEELTWNRVAEAVLTDDFGGKYGFRPIYNSMPAERKAAVKSAVITLLKDYNEKYDQGNKPYKGLLIDTSDGNIDIPDYAEYVYTHTVCADKADGQVDTGRKAFLLFDVRSKHAGVLPTFDVPLDRILKILNTPICNLWDTTKTITLPTMVAPKSGSIIKDIEIPLEEACFQLSESNVILARKPDDTTPIEILEKKINGSILMVKVKISAGSGKEGGAEYVIKATMTPTDDAPKDATAIEREVKLTINAPAVEPDDPPPPGPAPTSAVSNLNCSALSSSSIYVSWDKVSDASYYWIKPEGRKGKSSRKASITFGSLASSTNYTFTVRGGHNKALGPKDTITCTTKPAEVAAPSEPQAKPTCACRHISAATPRAACEDNEHGPEKIFNLLGGRENPDDVECSK